MGRESEATILAEILAYARDGRSGALVLFGDPGIGKTALLDLAVAQAPDFQVLRVRAVESEAEVAFGGLQELLTPVVDRMKRLTTRERTVLEGAIGLGPPVPGDPLAVRAATLDLLTTVAEDGPVLITVDDAHWLDAPSVAALSFAARRLDRDGIAILVAARTIESELLGRAGLDALLIRQLSDEATRALVKRADASLAPSVVEALVGFAQGNPLAAVELPRSLTSAQREGLEPLTAVIPIGHRLRDAFARRVDSLPHPTRRALVVLAASESDDAPLVTAALRACGLSPEVLEPAREGGLIVVDADRIRFIHPLVRSIAYHEASVEQQRGAHAALADVASATGESRAWHLAYAAAAVDEEVASGLESAARNYEARGALTTAARAAERAAELSPEVPQREQRLLLSASLAYRAGSPRWAREICQRGLKLALSPSARAQFEHVAALIDRDAGSMLEAQAQLSTAANRIARDDPLIASSILMDAILADYMAGDLRAAVRTSRRAIEIAEACPPAVRTLTAGISEINQIYSGERRLHDLDFAALAGTLATTPELSDSMVAAVEMLLMGWLVVGGHRIEPPRAEILNELIAARRRDGSLSTLPWLLSAGAAIDLREDRWLRATARASEATELARHTDQGAPLAWALYHWAWIEACRSDEAPCRAHAAEALEIARTLEAGSVEVYVAALLGVLELGLGNFGAAADHLDECARRAEESGLGQPEVVRYEPELVEAFLADGRDAAAYAERLHERAERTGSPWALATAARCRGLLADDGDIDRAFGSALALHGTLPSGFERARTRLCYGERLRRARRNTDAREHLNDALVTFERLGATGWADRARRELHATGVMTRSRAEGTFDELTAQELRVVLTIADGATIRETANHLFLSPKTIEAHLGRAYRKLGVRNRAEMATKVARLSNTSTGSELYGIASGT